MGIDLGDESSVPYCDSGGAGIYICQTLENCMLKILRRLYLSEVDRNEKYCMSLSIYMCFVFSLKIFFPFGPSQTTHKSLLVK